MFRIWNMGPSITSKNMKVTYIWFDYFWKFIYENNGNWEKMKVKGCMLHVACEEENEGKMKKIEV